MLEDAYSDTKHSGYRFSCNLVKIALRGVYELTVSIRLFRYRQPYADDQGTNWKRQNMCIQNRGIKNNGCGMSEVTSNVHEMVGYQLDDIRIYLSTEFGNRNIGSRHKISSIRGCLIWRVRFEPNLSLSARWYYADPECFGTGYSYADM